MDEVAEVGERVALQVYGRALGWGYLMGVGYRYLSLAQSVWLLRLAAIPPEVKDVHVGAVLQAGGLVAG